MWNYIPSTWNLPMPKWDVEYVDTQKHISSRDKVHNANVMDASDE